jgi:hypothetical protein
MGRRDVEEEENMFGDHTLFQSHHDERRVQKRKEQKYTPVQIIHQRKRRRKEEGSRGILQAEAYSESAN